MNSTDLIPEFYMCSYKNEGKGIVRDLICHCFEYSVDDINHDFLKNGKSTIMERIQMTEKNSPFPIANSHGRLECKDLWGASAIKI